MSRFKYLIQEPNICGGDVRVKGTRMKPMHVVGFIKKEGLKEFMAVWDYIPREAVKECFTYMKISWSRYENS